LHNSGLKILSVTQNRKIDFLLNNCLTDSNPSPVRRLQLLEYRHGKFETSQKDENRDQSAWASEGFFQGGANGGFFLNFPGGEKVVNLDFYHSKLRK